MTISSLDKSIKEIVDKHSVYGVECTINAIVRACIASGDKYLNRDELVKMIDSEYRHVATFDK